MRDHDIDAVLAKNSGGSATYAKIAAARDLGIEVVAGTPTVMPDAPFVATVEEAVARDRSSRDLRGKAAAYRRAACGRAVRRSGVSGEPMITQVAIVRHVGNGLVEPHGLDAPHPAGRPRARRSPASMPAGSCATSSKARPSCQGRATADRGCRAR